MVKRPTIADLAIEAGVSVATVDRVLNRRLPVSEDTTVRVVHAAERIGYHATGLLKRRLVEVPRRTFGFLLQKRHDAFYQSFAAALVQHCKQAAGVEARPMVEFEDELVPAAIAARILDLARRCDALAIVAVDHPLINAAVEEVTASGKRVFTLLSDVTAPSRTAYLAVDSRKAGRTAAWTISRLARTPGKIAILLGSHRYLSQEMAEMSFRSYMREHAPAFQLLEPIVNLDDERIAYEAVVNLLGSHRDLAGIYDCGGGQEGMIRALRDEAAQQDIVAVCNELTASTKTALIDGTVDMVLSTPVQAIAGKVVELMCRPDSSSAASGLGSLLFPADIHISETI